ncbi:10372_t:CDS:2, partial [Gigaspora margarita]
YGGNGLTKSGNLRYADLSTDEEKSNKNSDDNEDGSEVEFDNNEKSDKDEES